MTSFLTLTILVLFSKNLIISAFIVTKLNPRFTSSSKSIYSSNVVTNKEHHKFNLNAIAIPAEQEDEKKKRRRNSDDDYSNDDNKDWTVTKGGFIPNILQRRKSKQQQTQQSKPDSKIHFVDNIYDYKDVVVNEKERMVVVRFFASWCRSCKATKPLFSKLVHKYSKSNVKFVEVPLTKETAYLQEGLGVPSVPFAHIYHPEVGLVEEMKISKPHFSKFRQELNSYVLGSCNIEDNDRKTEGECIGAFE